MMMTGGLSTIKLLGPALYTTDLEQIKPIDQLAPSYSLKIMVVISCTL